MQEEKINILLEAADWRIIIYKLTRYAYWMARKYSWNSGKCDQLSAGKTPEDIACEAVTKVLKGTRKWDSDKYPDLLTHLKWIVKSDMGHLFSSVEHELTAKIPEKQNDEGFQVEYIENLPDTSFLIPGEISAPDQGPCNAESEANEKNLLRVLQERVDGDEDLELILMCLEEGFDKPSEIAEQTGWEIAKVYNLKRKLLRKTADIIKNGPKGE